MFCCCEEKDHCNEFEYVIVPTDDLDDNNNFFIMAHSGAKGKGINIAQIMGALGQDIFKGKRIEKEVNNRTLPHYHQNDDTPMARGYIEHSYLDGLTPQEFFFHP